MKVVGPVLSNRMAIMVGSGYLLGDDKKLEDFIRNVLFHVLWKHVSLLKVVQE